MNSISRVFCYGCLALALPIGGLGIALGAAKLPMLGGLCFLVAGFMLVLTVGLSCYDMSKTAKQDEADEKAVEAMLADGRLGAKLRSMGYDTRALNPKSKDLTPIT